ncbi:MAG: ShlB/FhaC/HecB family hemolysin secretion/activation protein [Candidatus Berkiella sp.]
MTHKIAVRQLAFLWSFIITGALPFCVFAQQVPSAADIGRIKPEEKLHTAPQPVGAQINPPAALQPVAVPPGAKSIRFVLKQLEISGSTAFSSHTLQDYYSPYIGKEITLDRVYQIAALITDHYHNAGYFLTRAYVPAQEIENGVVEIRVVEGYINEVEITDKVGSMRVVRAYIDQLTTQKPTEISTLESTLLLLNDLSGVSFSAILSPLENAPDGAIKLALITQQTPAQGKVSFDNWGSRFLGPNQLTTTYRTSLLPLQETTVSALTSLPADELNYFTLSHSGIVAPRIKVGITGSITRAEPGYTLKPFDIESASVYLGANITYQWIRQRQENLAFMLTIDGRNTSSNILSNTPFTDERIRAMRAETNYDMVDGWQGTNAIRFTMSQGIDGLGSSNRRDANLSRSQAKPDFSKLELSLSRLQAISPIWSLWGTASGQVASGPLFSSEEFGYGGQAFGRAYDSSDITGDDGVSGSVELRYDGFEEWKSVSISPYIFYDVGVIWNKDIAQDKRASAASAGFGLRVSTLYGVSGETGLAFPLINTIDNPIYGQEHEGPRIILRISKDF